mgnify:CR=1 FL=1
MPIRPSDNGWTAEQIREKGYQGIERLFDKVKTSLDTVIDDLNAKADQAEVAEDIAYLSNNLSILDSKIDDKDTELKAKIEQIENAIKDISIGNDFATKEDLQDIENNLQNVIEIAEGKTQTYVINYNARLPEEEALMYVPYYDNNGNRVSSYSDLQAYLGVDWDLSNELVNNKFNSNTEQVTMYDSDSGRGYILANRTMSDGSARNVFVKTFDRGISFLNSGDIIIVQQTDVPDRWVSGGSAYKMETSKIDLSTVVHKTGDEEITGVKTFNGGIKLAQGEKVDLGNNAKIYLGQYNNLIIDGGNTDTISLNAYETYINNLKVSGKVDLGKQVEVYSNEYNGFVIKNLGVVNYAFYSGYCIVPSIYPAVNNAYDVGSNNNGYYRKGYINEIVSEGTAQYKKVQCLTQSEYDALSTKDENVLYLIKE